MDHSCNGGCGSCNGCAKELSLTAPEVQILQQLGQIPFLPVARKADDMTPVCLELTDQDNASAALMALETKSLITIDYKAPLSGASMEGYQGLPVQGSIALTRRGQLVLEMLEIQGIEE